MIRNLTQKAIIFALLFLVSGILQAQPAKPRVENGVIDLRKWDFATQKAALAGDWNFYENELLVDPKNPGKQIHFPEVLSKAGFEMVQYGTYTARVLVPGNLSSLAFEIPQLYSS
nr:hypothetical protein [Cyclobacteriaceae bacterium]